MSGSSASSVEGEYEADKNQKVSTNFFAFYRSIFAAVLPLGLLCLFISSRSVSFVTRGVFFLTSLLSEYCLVLYCVRQRRAAIYLKENVIVVLFQSLNSIV